MKKPILRGLSIAAALLLALGALYLTVDGSWGSLSGRKPLSYLGYVLSLVPLLAGYLGMLGNPRRQAWHDLLAKSVVIRRGSQQINDNAHDFAPMRHAR